MPPFKSRLVACPLAASWLDMPPLVLHTAGIHTVLLKMWREDSGPCMQMLHFGFALGAFAAPLIARQFLSELLPDDVNSTSINLNGSEIEHGESQFYIAYWVSSSLFVPTLCAFIYYACKCEIARSFFRQEKQVKERELKDVSKFTMSDVKMAGEKAFKIKVPTSKKEYPTLYTYTVVLLLGLFMLVYVGLVMSYGSWIFTAVVTGPLHFTKARGTIIQSLFWGTFAFTRLFSVVLSLANVRTPIIIAGNLAGTLVASTIMMLFHENATAIWLASALLGTSFASSFPNILVFMSETIEPTGIATSIIVTGGTLGDISLPAAMGALIAKVDPNSIFYMTFVGVVLSTIVFTIVFFVTFFYQRHLQHQRERLKAVGDDKGLDKLMDSESGTDNEEQ